MRRFLVHLLLLRDFLEHWFLLARGFLLRGFVLHCFAERLFPRPLVDPSVDCLVPELRVLWLQHPVAFVGKVEHLRRNVL